MAVARPRKIVAINSERINEIFANTVQIIAIINCPSVCEMINARQASIIAISWMSKPRIKPMIGLSGKKRNNNPIVI